MSNWTPITRDGAHNWSPNVRAVTPVAPAILTSALPQAFWNEAYSQTLQITGTPTPTVTVTDGELPDGLTLDGRTINGSALVPQVETFEITATNSEGSDVKEFTIVVPNQGFAFMLPSVTQVDLGPPVVEVVQDATVDLIATVLDENGDPIPNIAGAAATSNPAMATAEWLDVTDADGNAVVRVTGITGGQVAVWATVDGIESSHSEVIVQAVAAPQIQPVAPPSATVGLSYSLQLQAIAAPAATWDVASGTLPPGLTLSSTGLVSGTPTGTVSQSYTFTARATNEHGEATVSVTIEVSVTMVPPSITTVALPAMTLGQSYSAQMQASGGDPKTWTVATGTFPSGLTLSASGAISGTPTSAGSFTFTVVVTNAGGVSSREFTVVVALPAGNRIVINSISPNAVQNEDVRGVVFAAPGPGQITGHRIGEFSGKRFMPTENGASLTVLTTEFGGGTLIEGTQVCVYLEDADEATHIFEATVAAA